MIHSEALSKAKTSLQNLRLKMTNKIIMRSKVLSKSPMPDTECAGDCHFYDCGCNIWKQRTLMASSDPLS